MGESKIGPMQRAISETRLGAIADKGVWHSRLIACTNAVYSADLVKVGASLLNLLPQLSYD